MNNKRIVVLIVLATFFLTGCANIGVTPVKRIEPFETQDFLMGTVISQRVYGDNAQKAAQDVLDKLKEIERSMTIITPGGEINKLNSEAGKNWVKLSSETLYVLEKARKFSELSGGAFDATIGPLVKAWGVFTENPRVPSKEEIERLLRLVDYKDININKTDSSARLEKPGQIVDLGGIAKGHAGDEAIKIYKKYGIKSAYANLGGNVVVLGSKPDGNPWRVGIQNPRAENGVYIGIVPVTDKAVVTSGDYERFFEEDDKKYHHILNPKTGYPADSGLISTTIIADASIDADALSTATFVLGLEKGKELVENLEGVEAIFITDNKEIYVTQGLKNNFIFVDESKEFKYVEKR